MKKVFIAGILILISFGFIYAGYRLVNSATVKILLMKSKMQERFEEPVLGVYDRQENISQAKAKSLRHYALILNNDKNWEIPENLLSDLPIDIPVLLTVEMWDSSILRKVARGDYDENINAFFSEILANDREIYIRWNPEMEVPGNNNFWSNQPHYYIPAFRRFSELIEEVAPHAHIIFAPSGYPGALENYPGDDVVNAQSITINSDSENKISLYKEKSLQDQVKRKLHRLRFVDKPIFILGSQNMEEGSFGDKEIKDATDFIVKNKAIVYSERNFIHPKPDSTTKVQEIMIGLYDPDQLLIDEPAVSIEHLFIDFRKIESGLYEQFLKEALSRNNDLIITVEPKKNDKKEDPLIIKGVIDGNYDALLKKFYAALPKTNRTIYLRFAHEMEIPITRYPWQSQDPVVYIEAFRYFMQFPGSDSPNIVKIWGPAGDRGSLEWWPGEDVVDMVSIAIYGLPDKNITDPEKQESFDQIFSRKSRRLRFVDKPIFITEFGVKGDEAYQTRWLKNAAETINKKPQIFGVSYFNKVDNPEVWGEGMSPPEWSISRNSFLEFLASLERDPVLL